MHNSFHHVAQQDSSCAGFVDQERRPHKVILKKGSSGLGFSIIGGEEHEGIFVSFLLAGGPADLSGQIRRGDQLLYVNGLDLRRASHSEAASLLKQSGGTVEIICQYRPEDYYRCEARRQELEEQIMESHPNTGTLKTTQKRTFYVRALFDYDPHRDSGLPSRGVGFKHGDILQVTNASDDEWWQARKVTGDIVDEDLGIIPGRKRVERKERSRMKNVKFVGKDSQSTGSHSLEKKKKHLFSRKLLLTRPKDRSHSDSSMVTSEESQLTEKVSSDEPGILSYEAVIRQELKNVQPIIILGPLKQRFMEDLVAEFPEKFAICIPHTTRPMRDHEVDGLDFHFVASRDQMEHDMQDHAFVEAGQFNDHLYGTTIQAIKDVAETGKQGLLDVGGSAVKKLQGYGFYPAVIFIRPRCIDSVMEWNKRMTADQARVVFEQTVKQEQDFKQWFTAILTGDDINDLYAKLKDLVLLHSIPVAWMPSKEKL